MAGMRIELSKVSFAEPLLCGMTGCATPTTSGLLEPDNQTSGLWRLLPICPDCSTSLTAPAPARKPGVRSRKAPNQRIYN